MALLWVEGFDQYGSSGTVNVTVQSAKYNTDSGSRDLTAATGRTGNCVRIDFGNLNAMLTPPLTTNLTLITGFAYYVESVSEAASRFFTIRQDTVDGSTVGYDCIDLLSINQTIMLSMFGTGVNTSANVITSVNTWYYIEVKVYCHDTNGTVEVRVDGTPIITYSGDTRQASFWDYNSMVGFRGAAAAANIRIDDWYVCDGSGTTCNDFLGDCKVYTLFPDGDASGNMTANSGSDEYAMVNDATVNVTNYIKDTTSGNQAVFTYGGLPVTPNTVYGVMVTTEAEMSGNLYKGMKTLSQNGSGTINAHTSAPVREDISVMTEVFGVNADGNTWTPALVNDARFGVRVV